MALSQAAIQADASTVSVALTAGNASKLMLTQQSDGKSYYYTDASHLDAQHKVEKVADSNHLKSIVVAATITPDNGFNVADATYYVTVAVASETPLRISNVVTGEGNEAFVGATKTIAIPVIVSNGAFTEFTATFYLSMTGTDGSNETTLAIVANNGFDYTWATTAPSGSVAPIA